MNLNEAIASGNVVVSQEKLAIGVRVPKSVESPMDFLYDLRDYTKTGLDIYRKIDLCNQLYENEGTVGSAVDILTEFAATEIWAEDTGNKKLNKILEFFNSNVNNKNTGSLAGLTPIVQQLSLEFFLSGNAFPYTVWEYVDVPKMTAPVKLPISVTLLNPRSIHIPEDSFAFGNEQIYYISTQLSQILKQDGRQNRDLTPIRKNLTPNVIKKLKESKNGNILLDPEYITHIKRKARDYQIWGIPYLTRTFSAVATIKRLRKLDEATTEGLINLLTIFKLGSDDHPAGADRMQAFASLLSDPAASTMLVWSHDLEVETHGPDGKILGFKDKYKEAYDELLRALGVHPGLMGTPTSVNWQDLLALIVKLQAWRDLIIKWVEKIYRQIAENNGFEDIYPKAKMARMSLMDDTAIKNMILNFYDRGLLDPDTALREGGYNFDSILEKKKELKSEMSNFMPPMLPFSGQDNRGTSAPTKKPVVKAPTSNTVNLQNQGRK